MNDRDHRPYDRHTRVETFGRENSGDFAQWSKGKTHFANMDQHLKGPRQGHAHPNCERMDCARSSV